MLRLKGFALAAALMWLALPVKAAWVEPEPDISTQPIGSPFYRHLAQELNLDLRQLVKFEKNGVGRSEIVALIMISSSTGKPLRDYGNRRLKTNVTLEELAAEAHIDHAKLISEARGVKEQIEAMGETDLPPPLYEMGEIITPVLPKLTKAERKANKKATKQREKEAKEKKDTPSLPKPTELD